MPVVSARPLSPHLSIYRPLIGAFTSILHRAMNAALLIGCVFLALWLAGIALGGALYETLQVFWSHWVGQAMLFGWTFAGWYSAAQWVRHFAWDLGYGFEPAVAQRSGVAAIGFGLVATLAIWVWVALG